MIASIKDKTLVLVLPLMPLLPSKSGRSRILASTGGGKASEVVIDGKPVIVNVTAYVKN